MVVTKKLLEVRGERLKPDEAKPLNIVDMALSFSAMMRLFQQGSKEIIHKQIMEYLPRFINSKSEDEFKAVHHDFCLWGTTAIYTAEKEQKDGSIKNSEPASYGQIAKTLDVVLHVLIHYAQHPNTETAKALSKWLNTAMDTKMMAFLSGCYPDALKPWPKTIEQVKKEDYVAIQKTVRLFIQEEHLGKIRPVDVDDVYWAVLNRKDIQPSRE